MSNLEDSAPVSSRAKRKKFCARAATTFHKDVTAANTDSGVLEPRVQLFNNKAEFDAVILKIREAVRLKRARIKQNSDSTSQEIEVLKSKLSKQEEIHRQLEQQLASNLEEMKLANADLTELESGFTCYRQTMDAQYEHLKQASANIKSLQDVANTVPDLLHRTTFKEKENSILKMLRPLCQDLAQEYLGSDNMVLPDTAGIIPAVTQEVDEDTKQNLLSLLRGLRTHKSYQIFAQPVTEEVAPRYFEVVKRPMDLSTIRRKLDSDLYTSLSDFSADARLMFDNCRIYSGNASRNTEAADGFEQQMWHLMDKRGLKGL